MASSLVEKIHVHFLQCGICLETFQNPRALPCLHAFCEDCLERWYKTNKTEHPKVLICPNCAKSAAIPSEGIKGFPTHFLVNSLQDTVNMERLSASEDFSERICTRCRDCNESESSSSEEEDSKPNVECWRCHEYGHYARNCNQSEDKSSSEEEDSKPDVECWTCHEYGHYARNCNQSEDKSSSEEEDTKPNVQCWTCHEYGHYARNCNQSEDKSSSEEEDSKPDVECWRCHRHGHYARNCDTVCYNCRETGHVATDCSEPRRKTANVTCYKCHEYGHYANKCYNY